MEAFGSAHGALEGQVRFDNGGNADIIANSLEDVINILLENQDVARKQVSPASINRI